MNTKLLLLITIILALFLRFYRLGDYPAFNADEAALGYNAYSLIETGRDEHGNDWPLHFQSFNDYKPGLYVYVILPFVKLFGLSEMSVRAPNAMFGVLSVWVLYHLVNLLFKNFNNLRLTMHNLKPGLIAALFLAISPWHIHFSRGAWEVNVSTFLILLGTLFFTKYVERNNNSETSRKTDGYRNLIYLFFSVIAFGISMYSYHAARIIVPLQALGLVGIYFDIVKKDIRNFSLAALLGVVILLPLVNEFTKSEITSRASGVGLLADSGPYERVNEQRGEHEDFNGITTKILHNKLVNYSLRFFENYSEHFHGLFLVLSGDDIQRNKVPETGQMYMLDILWVIMGGIWMVKNWNQENRQVLHWLLIAPFAAALTFQSPHALRAQNMVIPLIILASAGFIIFVNWLKTTTSIKFVVTTCYILLAGMVFWQFARYLDAYYKHMSQEYPYSSQYGVKELVGYLDSDTLSNVDNVVVTTRYDQPYILFLFFSKYSPQKFQEDHTLTTRDSFGFSTVPGYNKFIFKQIDWDLDRTQYPNSLIIGTSEEIPDSVNIVQRIYGTNGYEYFRVVAN